MESHGADPIAVCKFLSDDGAVLNELVKYSAIGEKISTIDCFLSLLKDISTFFRRVSKVIKEHVASLAIMENMHKIYKSGIKCS